MPRGVKKKKEEEEESSYDDYTPDASTKSGKAKGKQPTKAGNGIGAVAGSTALPGTENINITVHFPVARIKRIMQADDDVGKVAQVTPVVVSKALELFMISLVTKAAAEAKARNSKRVGAGHLKQAITKDEQFDFLSDIMAKVADAPPAADKQSPDAMDVDGKKPRKTPGRRKKKTDDDEF
ncbi:histone-fold-containing protein [Pleomassaria siparia CBS 279.74]|uniref:NCT transcriptional regulatory complex subunit A n=1 Tax=Pleomassaria siparia CBS 279.74 TaxID=1314801 RepID=A0A6G1KQC4_9PLEO|nr:histone-fold-containing protein [Pleomassaria siparia CBS 279.74]